MLYLTLHILYYSLGINRSQFASEFDHLDLDHWPALHQMRFKRFIEMWKHDTMYESMKLDKKNHFIWENYFNGYLLKIIKISYV